jgi:acyl carrier protein
MKQEEFLREVEKMLELEINTLTMDTLIADVEEWDSMSAVSFLALCDSKYDKLINPMSLKGCKTFEDLIKLI